MQITINPQQIEDEFFSILENKPLDEAKELIQKVKDTYVLIIKKAKEREREELTIDWVYGRNKLFNVMKKKPTKIYLESVGTLEGEEYRYANSAVRAYLKYKYGCELCCMSINKTGEYEYTVTLAWKD